MHVAATVMYDIM